MYKILLTEFPFTENPRKKKRPVLQISEPQSRYKILVAAYITSRAVKSTEFDVVLDKLEGSGLTRKSTIRLFKLSNFVASDIKGEIGVLPQDKVSEVRSKLKKLLQIL